MGSDLINKTRKELIEIIDQLNEKLDAGDSKPSRDIKDKDERSTRKRQATKDITERKQMEEALRKSEKSYRELIEKAGIAILIDDREGNFAYFNETFTELFGYSAEEIKDKSIQSLVHPDDVDRVSQFHKERLQGKKVPSRYEFRGVRKDGSGIYLEVAAVKLEEEESTVGTRSYIWDITERKQAEEALSLEKENLVNVFDAMVDGVYIVNQQYDIQFVNHVLIKDFGSYEGRKCYEYFHDRTEVCPWCKNSDVFVGRTVQWEWFSSKNGKTYDLIGTPLKNPDGSISKLEIFRDITERKQAEEALRQSEKDYRDLFNNATDAIYIQDKEGHFLNVNQGAVDMYNYPKEFFIGKTPEFLSAPGKNDMKKIIEFVQDAFSGKPRQYDFWGIRKSGEVFPKIVRSQKGIYLDKEAVITFALDITERKKAEEKLKNTLAELQKLKDQTEKENIYLKEEIKLEHNFGEIVGQSNSLKKMFNQVELVSRTDTSVLILGETGTGKELVARAIHGLSKRKDRSLVKVNCSALPKELIESELFGHVKGAFTSAVEKKIGRFELADKGTIFLDEIVDLPLNLQSRLLRVLQENEFERIGSSTTIKVDVRVIAATNRNLEKLVLDGEFRQDLYYRLNVFPITCPPLRERNDDIPFLVNHFVNKYSLKMGKRIKTVPQNVIKSLQNYHWPGNVRELENVIERAMVINQSDRLQIGDWFIQSPLALESMAMPSLKEYEKHYIIRVLEKTNWRIRGKNGAAQILGLQPTTLESRMQKLEIIR